MKAKRRKVMKGKVIARGSAMESMKGYGAVQHQGVVPTYGQGPMGSATVQIGPRRAAPKPPVGGGKGFRGI